ncbi:MAG: hypothetical protein IT521_09905 [Burkholderiales bacterium]|nr:hypothetical protein [Burkholderiales bacterium]
MLLTPSEAQAIEDRVAALEKARGVEVVTLVTTRSDDYPETVWTAFAFGAALTALAVTAADWLHPDGFADGSALPSTLAILGVGALCALVCVYVPAATRLFLRGSRATQEVDQHARVQFLERQLFATPARTSILLLVSLLERRVVILADSGLRQSVGDREWDAVIEPMALPLRSGDVGAALQAGLGAIDALLARKKFPRGAGGLFADRPVEESGA